MHVMIVEMKSKLLEKVDDTREIPFHFSHEFGELFIGLRIHKSVRRCVTLLIDCLPKPKIALHCLFKCLNEVQ